MIDRDAAVALCEEHFPRGLERLINLLSVRVDRSDIGDVDGWCYYLPDGKRVVRLCSAKTRERQRFTLAHELAHFVLDSQHRQMTIIRDVYNPKGREEREADALASRLLLPSGRVKDFIGNHLIEYSTINQLKKKVGVSDIVVALRLARSANDFGLDRPAVIWFQDGQVEKSLPHSPIVDFSMITSLFLEATESPSHMSSKEWIDGTMVIASLLPNTNYPTLFYYHASPDAIQRDPKAEMMKELEKMLFHNDAGFRNSLNGYIGAHKTRLLEMDVVESVVFIVEHFKNDQLHRSPELIAKSKSPECIDYLIIRMLDLQEIHLST